MWYLSHSILKVKFGLSSTVSVEDNKSPVTLKTTCRVVKVYPTELAKLKKVEILIFTSWLRKDVK